MKNHKLFLFIIHILFASNTYCQINSPDLPPVQGDWKVTFVEEFNDSELDNAQWKVGQHWGGINGQAQPHQDNIFLEDGSLVFKWDKKDEAFTFGNKSTKYGAGEVSTYKRFHQKYGYFECRLKYNVNRGCWPAFWTMPVVNAYSPLEITQSYLKFKLSGELQNVENAKLKIKIKSFSKSDYWFDIYASGDSWNESSLTWDNKAPFNAIFLDHIKPGKEAGEWIEIDVTTYINEQLQQDQIASFVLADMYQQGCNISFFSKETGEENCPYLEIDGAKVKVSEDASVYAAGPDVNYGSMEELKTYESWGYNVSTYMPGMEIDIYESIGIWGENKFAYTWHWDGYGDDHKSEDYLVTNAPDQNEFNTYGLYWAPDTLEFYLNGELIHRHVGAEVCAAESFMILSAQLGGWSGNTDDLAINFDPYLPLYMYVDYVKVWSGTKELATNSVKIEQPINIKVTPNPIDEKVTIVLPHNEEYLLEVFDLKGFKLYSTALTQPSNIIDMGSYKPNVYLLKLQSKSGKAQTFKIVKN